MEWILLVFAAIFILTILSGGDSEDAVTNTAFAGLAGLGCAWELFKIGAGVFFFLWVVQACFG
tara:strand:- start:382 stop:570 length:189 start_codon:yes stop_codon:yes gene_type:complete